MFNLRFCTGAAAVAFILSLVFGAFSGSQLLSIILRAVVLGGVFFVLAAGINIVANQFLPELMDPVSTNDEISDRHYSSPGANLDISVGESVSVDNPGEETDSEEDLPAELEEIDDGETMFPPGIGNQTIVSRPPLDQNREDRYNINEQGEVKPAVAKAGIAIPDQGDLGSVDSLPELGNAGLTLAAQPEVIVANESTAFVPGIPTGINVGSGIKRKTSKSPMDDFNPKDVASAIQTVLRREDKG